jgi:hypothetical protein
VSGAGGLRARGLLVVLAVLAAAPALGFATEDEARREDCWRAEEVL